MEIKKFRFTNGNETYVAADASGVRISHYKSRPVAKYEHSYLTPALALDLAEALINAAKEVLGPVPVPYPCPRCGEYLPEHAAWCRTQHPGVFDER